MTNTTTEKSYRGIIIAMVLSLVWMGVTAVIGTLGLYEYQRDGCFSLDDYCNSGIAYGCLFATLYDVFRHTKMDTKA